MEEMFELIKKSEIFLKYYYVLLENSNYRLLNEKVDKKALVLSKAIIEEYEGYMIIKIADFVRKNGKAGTAHLTLSVMPFGADLYIKSNSNITFTEEDADGAAYPDDVEQYMLDTYKYVSDNLYLIETLLHQHVMDGVKPTKYRCKDSDMIWEEEKD